MPIGLILGGVMCLALAILGFAYEREKVQLHDTQATLSSLSTAHDQLVKSDKDLKALNDTQANLLGKQDKEIADLNSTQQAILDKYNKQHSEVLHAKPGDDGPAAPILKYVAASMRSSTDSVRSGNETSVSTVSNRPSATPKTDSGSNKSSPAVAIGSGSLLSGRDKGLRDIFGPQGHPPKGN